MSRKKHIDDIEQVPIENETLADDQIEADEISQEDELSKLSKERDEWKDKYLRSMAEFENFRRRTNQEKSDWIKRSTEKLALNVCDVLDNFERAITKLEPGHQDDNLIKGFLLIEQQLRSVLEREGVKKLEALGESFDPEKHEALAHIPSPDFEENTVAAVIQNGYTMNDILVRPVRVAVSSGSPLSEKTEFEENKE